MALGSTQPLTEMGTRIISWGQRRPVRKAENLPPSFAVVTKSGNLNFLEPSGHLWVFNGTAYLLPNNASKWQMGIQTAFKGVIAVQVVQLVKTLRQFFI